jgi:osmotically inducible protein OsmC
MAVAERRASAVWSGDLAGGNGEISFDSSGVAKGWPITWAARTEAPGGKTSPEELIAAAHAACYAMALSNSLTKDGHKPERLAVTATVSFEVGAGGARVSKSVLEVSGKIAGLDQNAFQAAAEKGEKGCPVSNALRGNVDITVRATLDA